MLDSAAKDSSAVKAPVQLDELLWPLTKKDSCFRLASEIYGQH